MYFPYYTLLLSFFIPSIICKSPQEIICSAELGCVCMWALRLSNKILFSEGKPPPAQKGPSEPAGARQVWHGALELTQVDQIQPWWPPRCPGEGPAVQTRHGGSSEHPLCWPLGSEGFASAPPFPGWFPTPVLLQKVLEECWPETASSSYKPQILLLLMLCKSASKY